MTTPRRLPGGGRIDRNRPLRFVFNGRRLDGFAGDTLASALLANGEIVVGRSVKYHRRRGIVAASVEEPNAIIQLGEGARTVPNARATEIELHDGLVARSVNAWPGVSFDVLAVNGLFSRFLQAGFYYKTFMRPSRAWMLYERAIRRVAGLGVAPAASDPDRYDKMNAHCDVLVAGAGPAGLLAALTAARTGARVILADEQAEFGGHLLTERVVIDNCTALDWVANVVRELATYPEVRLLPRTTVAGYYDHNLLSLVERRTDHLPPGERKGTRERLWRVRAKEVVIAAGAHERPLVFGNNDLPGVMLASAVSTFVNRYAVMPGSRIVVFTNNDHGYRAALDLADAGASEVSIIDPRPSANGTLPALATAQGIQIRYGMVVTEALGRRRVRAVRIAPAAGNSDGAHTRIACDLVAMSGGWSPVVHLHSQAGGRPVWDDARACFVPGKAAQRECSIGAANGTFALAALFEEAGKAGAAAVAACGFGDGSAPKPPAVERIGESPLLPLWLVRDRHPEAKGLKKFVDFQNDVTVADLHLAVREGYRSIEQVKRYTALGFGTEQGKLGNINAMAIVAEALGQSIAATGTTTFRPNYTPVSFGAIAGGELGELFDPVRKTALHAWHVEQRAVFEDVGQWKRPRYYPRAGESLHEATARECSAVRNSVGVFDASTLGKIDIQGPDAVTLLDWVYTNAWSKLQIGKCRYGLMLDENGMVIDDGVTTRLAPNRFLMTTTTSGAARVNAWLERWLQTEWPDLKVYLTSVTDHWATLAVAGPQSRRVLSVVCNDIDFSNAAFPFMSFREGRVAGIGARIMRISFSGELCYEINVPANHARHAWDAVMTAGQAFDITPYGTEAMHVLRAEKGYIIVGQDTDGSQTPVDLGMESLIAKTKDFLGRRSLERTDTALADRKRFVGLLAENPQTLLPEGGQIVRDPGRRPPVPMEGHVTSSYMSPALGRSIALALVRRGHQRYGEKVHVASASGVVPATIVRPQFLDPEGARQNV